MTIERMRTVADIDFCRREREQRYSLLTCRRLLPRLDSHAMHLPPHDPVRMVRLFGSRYAGTKVTGIILDDLSHLEARATAATGNTAANPYGVPPFLCGLRRSAINQIVEPVKTKKPPGGGGWLVALGCAVVGLGAWGALAGGAAPALMAPPKVWLAGACSVLPEPWTLVAWVQGPEGPAVQLGCSQGRPVVLP